jgi:hypothetical protein
MKTTKAKQNEASDVPERQKAPSWAIGTIVVLAAFVAVEGLMILGWKHDFEHLVLTQDQMCMQTRTIAQEQSRMMAKAATEHDLAMKELAECKREAFEKE